MKKMIALALAIIMMISAFAAAYAEIGEDVLEVSHGTATIWLDDTERDFKVYDVYEEDGVIFAFFSEVSGEGELGIAFDDDLPVDYYEAADSDDIYAMVICDGNGDRHCSACADYAADEGKYCDLIMTVSNENGWYQGAVRGRTICEESGVAYEMIGAFDIVLESSCDIVSEESDEYHTNNCAVCSGTGLCSHCSDSTMGECGYCNYGRNDCFCESGACTICHGKGRSRFFDRENGVRYIDCNACGGSGRHDYCGGKGFVDCRVCDGNGTCIICDGSMKCNTCGGTGH